VKYAPIDSGQRDRGWTGQWTKCLTNGKSGPEGCIKVRVSAMKSEGMQTYGNSGKRLDYGGNGRERRGMVGMTSEIMGIPRNICPTMGSSPQCPMYIIFGQGNQLYIPL